MSDHPSKTPSTRKKLSASTPLRATATSQGISPLSLSSIESSKRPNGRKTVTFGGGRDIYEQNSRSLSQDDNTRDGTLSTDSSLSDDKMATEYAFSTFPSQRKKLHKVRHHDRTYTITKHTVASNRTFRSESFPSEPPKQEEKIFSTPALDTHNEPVRKKIRDPITTLTQPPLSQDNNTRDKPLSPETFLPDNKMTTEYAFSQLPLHRRREKLYKVGDHDRTYLNPQHTVASHHTFLSKNLPSEPPKMKRKFFTTPLDTRNEPVRKKRRYPITTPSLAMPLGWMSIHNVGKEILEEVRAINFDLRKYDFVDES